MMIGPRVPALLHCQWGISSMTHDHAHVAVLTVGDTIMAKCRGGRVAFAILEMIYGTGRKLDFGYSYASREQMLDALESRSIDPKKYHFYET